MHSAQWDHDYELRGKRVASIGTGASAIQYVPAIQQQVEKLYVFQRTAPWIMPHGARPISEREHSLFRRVPAVQRLIREGVYWAKELLVLGFVKQPRLMGALERLSSSHMRKQVSDPALLAKLAPDYALGCKRILPSNDWYPALQQPNVELVSGGLQEVREQLCPRQRRTRARGRRDHLRHGLPRGRPAGRRAGTWPRRQADARGLAGHAARLPGDLGAGLPEYVPAARAQHRPGPQLDGVHDRDADRARAAGDQGDGQARSEHDRDTSSGLRGVQPRCRRAHEGHRLGDRMHELLPGRHWAQRGAVAGLDVALSPACHAIRRGGLRAQHAQAHSASRNEPEANHHHWRRQRHRTGHAGRAETQGNAGAGPGSEG